MKHYEIWLNNTLVKSYPYKAQAVMWCFLNKYVNHWRRTYFLDPRVEIKEKREEK